MVIMTDASDVAAGAVLMQWQRAPTYPGEPPDLEPDACDKDDFLAQHRARIADGYQLVILGYFAKSFSGPQLNWAIYDKEAASILLALRLLCITTIPSSPGCLRVYVCLKSLTFLLNERC